MNLFAHIGTEKTGSSFLQSVMTKGRADLHASGLFVPRGTHRSETAAAAGLISAGNGELLAGAISIQNWTQVRLLLNQFAAEARSQNCDRVLISSERLLNPLAQNENLLQFQEDAQSIFQSPIRCLVVLRDPIGQAISLYKHRAKNGLAKPFAQWIVEDYCLAQDLDNFRRQIVDSQVKLSAMGYHSDGNELSRRFFADWLNVVPPQANLPERVNPSLRLTELLVLSEIAKVEPQIVNSLYDRLVKLPLESKAEDLELETHVRAIANQELAQYHSVWDFWNQQLPPDQRFRLPDSRAIEGAANHPDCSLSAKQIETLVQFFLECRRFGFRSKLWWHQVCRPRLGKLWRSIRAIKH